MKTIQAVLIYIMMAAIFTGCAGKPASTANQASGTTEYHLGSSIANGKMQFIGIGGDIADETNPTLNAKVGDTITITLTSTEGVEHNFAAPDFITASESVSGQGKSITFSFVVDKPGTFPYFCSIPGHREAGMEGKIVVTGEAANNAQPTANSMAGMTMDASSVAPTAAPAATDLVDIVRDPTDLPAPIGDRAPKNIRIDLETKEVNGLLADGTTYTYWTFNSQVPGPFIRIRVGDTVEVHLKNNASSHMAHSVDFHAVTGPGGGAVFTTTAPGQETMFSFKAIVPGLFVYHCATPMVAEHIANGMYGMILVEPEGGLPKVDREFYVMQGEIYTAGKFGDKGHQVEDVQKLLDEKPEYFVLNGAVGALTTQKPLKAKVGETIRIFYGVGGPNATAAFHLIGEMFDRVYNYGSVTTPPITDVQTVLVPPGGSSIVELALQVPGRYILVDHALARLQRGLAGYLLVEGPDAPDIFNGTPVPGSGH